MPQMQTARYPYPAAITAYGAGGFRFADMSHKGSLLCLPSGIYAWPVVRAGDVNLDTLAPVLAEADSIEVLLLGTGPSQVFAPSEVLDECTALGIVLEPMATGAAARTYNVLLAESRAVAAALIAVP
jgi:uncharacterized protein